MGCLAQGIARTVVLKLKTSEFKILTRSHTAGSPPGGEVAAKDMPSRVRSASSPQTPTVASAQTYEAAAKPIAGAEALTLLNENHPHRRRRGGYDRF